MSNVRSESILGVSGTFYAMLIISVVGLAFNLIWENAQAFLYLDYVNFWQHFPICARASLGDVLIVIFLYFALAVVNRDLQWFTKMSKVDLAITVVLGILIAVGIEMWSLGTARWEYAPTMPLVPYTNVGLSPILQMIILPPIIFLTSAWIIKRIKI